MGHESFQTRNSRLKTHSQYNPPVAALKGKERYWTEQSLALDWSGLDRPDPEKLNRILWHTLHGVNTPYPSKSDADSTE